MTLGSMFQRLGIWIATGLLCTGCFRPHIVTVDISVPQMRSPDCASLVERALGSYEEEAILETATDIDRQILTVTYDQRRLALKNLEYSLTAAGFDANDARADERARAALPSECR